MPEEQKALDNTPIMAYNIIVGKEKPIQTNEWRYIP